MSRRAGVLAGLCLSLCLLLAGCYPDLDWRPLTPPDARFTVLMPAKSQEDSRPIADGATMHMWTTRAGDTVFGAGYADFADDARNHFGAVRDALIGKSGNRVAEDREITLHDMAGRALRIDAAADGKAANARTVHVRLFSAGTRLYQLAVISRQDSIREEDIALYFDSFRIQPAASRPTSSQPTASGPSRP